MLASRVTIIVGHFGSGKTEIALNLAVDLAHRGARVALVDLDVVKPYFRSRSARAFMAELGVRVVAPQGENIHADLPIIVPEIRTLLRDGQARVLMDVGGDDTGARVVGSLADMMPLAETEHLLVLNFRRPFTDTVEAAVVMAREIEAAARLPLTGLVSNTHLMEETTPAIVLEGYRLAQGVGWALGVPVVAVAVDEGVHPQVQGQLDCPLVVLKRYLAPPFAAQPRLRRTGPLFVLN
ncbi:MAG: cobalamin biosynthesis protein CbiA [Thermoanaerobaculaceae bacterium]|nr:cobalamin biosynthesis protein CbiA [Thermoanaerobaculaceae bacterium]